MPSYIRAQISATITSLRARICRLKKGPRNGRRHHKLHERVPTPYPAAAASSSSSIQHHGGRKLTQQEVHDLYCQSAYAETAGVSAAAAAAGCAPGSSSTIIGGRESSWAQTIKNNNIIDDDDVAAFSWPHSDDFSVRRQESQETIGVSSGDVDEEEEDWRKDWEDVRGQLKTAEKRKAVMTTSCREVEEGPMFRFGRMWRVAASTSPDAFTGTQWSLWQEALAMMVKEEALIVDENGVEGGRGMMAGCSGV